MSDPPRRAAVPTPRSADEHASLVRFFLRKGLDFDRPDMVEMALQAAREAVALFSATPCRDADDLSRPEVLRTIPPVILAAYGDALAASGTTAQAARVEAVLARMEGFFTSPPR